MLNTRASQRTWSPAATWSPIAWSIGLLLASTAVAAAVGSGPGSWLVGGMFAGVSLSASVCSRNSAAVLLPAGGQPSWRDARLALAFLIGTASGALLLVPFALIGAGLASPIPRTWSFGVWLVVSGGMLVANVVTGSCPLPQMHRQIPLGTVASRRPLGAWRFGAALGTSAMTFMPSCAPYVLMAALVFVRPTVAATLIAAVGFGAGRAIGMLGRAGARDRAAFEESFQRVVAPLQRGLASATVILLVALWFWKA